MPNACDKALTRDTSIIFGPDEVAGQHAEIEFVFAADSEIGYYQICTHNDGDGLKEAAHPSSWEVHVKLSKPDDINDMSAQGDWVAISSVKDHDLSVGGTADFGKCASGNRFEAAYAAEVYLMSIFSVRSADPFVAQLSTIQFYDGDGTQLTPATIYSGNDQQSVKYYKTNGVQALVDADAATYWQTQTTGTAFIVVTFATGQKATQYSLTSSPSEAARDPKSWDWAELKEDGGGAADFTTIKYATVTNFAGASADLGRGVKYTVGPVKCYKTRSRRRVFCALHATRINDPFGILKHSSSFVFEAHANL